MKKCKIHIDLVFVSDDQSFESADPAYCSFYSPTSLILIFDLAVLQSVVRSVFLVWDQETYASLFQGFSERMAVVGFVGYELFRSRPGASSAGPGDADLSLFTNTDHFEGDRAKRCFVYLDNLGLDL